MHEDKLLREALGACALWRERFGAEVNRYVRHNTSRGCGDGREEWVTLIGSTAALEPLGATTEDRLEYVKDRGEERRLAASRNWVCGPWTLEPPKRRR